MGVCESAPPVDCDDGDFCETPDACFGNGVCLGGAADPCANGLVCIEGTDACLINRYAPGTRLSLHQSGRPCRIHGTESGLMINITNGMHSAAR